ncbi:TetR/AcrR family transcriptional regulator [Gottfriedia sp. NPDC056225]|uniref:TetR/AcrR family transcriptional regulator n=1 Tax=Gottfriedia sp. NPDC056225 TaxID=3345751 RepID=UPI0015583B90|nr:TetR/AcrR family transcriptional regulator [Arthrobacter citreus]
MENSNRKIISRRDRPAKEPLSNELIVRTAYELLKEEGVAGMSMRKIAKALDTGPSSLYVYVKNLQELSSLVLDYGLGQLVLPEPNEESWKENLFGALNAYFSLLYEEPGLAELSFSSIPVGTNFLRLTEYILSTLQDGGVKSRSAAWGVDLLLLYVSSVAYERTTKKKHGDMQIAKMKEAFQNADPVLFPILFGLGEEMFSGDTKSMERFHWGIEVLIHGIQHFNK